MKQFKILYVSKNIYKRIMYKPSKTPFGSILTIIAVLKDSSSCLYTQT